MLLLFLLICNFLQNGMTPDDLGLILAGGAVLILMIGVTCRAVVNTLPFSLLPIGLLTEFSSVLFPRT